MNLDEILDIPMSKKNIVVIGRAGAGKTWVANRIKRFYHDIIHTDDYIVFGESRAIEGIIEDAIGRAPVIIEGCLAYLLLTQGALEKSYKPDIIIECVISRAKQREIYLKERDSSKIQYLKKFHDSCMGCLNTYLREVPQDEQAPIYEFNNEY
jgi:hypothetical protein